MLHYRLKRDPRSSHQQIARLLKANQPNLTLDVGAAQGFLGQLLQGSGLVIDAIEPDPVCAETAKPFYRQVFASSVEAVGLSDGMYDAVVCADVLEHLPDPLTVLKQLVQAAKPGAMFLISVPNTGHWAVRLMTITGYRPKMDRGPLDRTHLHFFYRDSAEALLRDAGLKIEQVLSTGVPLEELWPSGENRLLFRFMRRSQYAVVDLMPRLAGFQWVFQARASKSE